MVSLFDYQKHAIRSMQTIEDQGVVTLETDIEGTSVKVDSRAGILADPTGSGKTITMLSFIMQRWKATPSVSSVIPSMLASANRLYGSFVHEEFSVSLIPVNHYSPVTICVVSPNITKQWANEAKRVLNEEVPILSTTKQVRKWTDAIRDNPHANKVVILNENRYKMFSVVTDCHKQSFARIVFDESRHMKMIYTSATTVPSVHFTWFMSAARGDSVVADDIFVHGVGSSMMTSMDCIPEYILRGFTVRTPQNEIHYPGSIVHTYYNVRTLSQVTDIIVDQLPPELSSRISAGDIHGAVAILGAESESDIFSVVLHRIEKEIRQCQFNIDEVELSLAAGIIVNDDRLRMLQSERERLNTKKSTTLARFDNLLSSGQCSICIDTFTSPVLISCCSNVFCSECIARVLVFSRKCPMCRSAVFKLHRVSESGAPVDDKFFENSAPPVESKIDTIKKILTTSMKAIVYSEVDSCIPLLTDLSTELDFKLCVLAGFQTCRAAALEAFKAEGRRAVLFASAMTDCSGIDLPQTTDIVLWHKLPPATEQQVIGRSRRVSTSSSHETTIHHLYREN